MAEWLRGSCICALLSKNYSEHLIKVAHVDTRLGGLAALLNKTAKLKTKTKTKTKDLTSLGESGENEDDELICAKEVNEKKIE